MFKQNSVLKSHSVWWRNIRKPKQQCKAGSQNLKQCYKSQRGSLLEPWRLPIPNGSVLALHKPEWPSGNLKRKKLTQCLILSDGLQICTWNISDHLEWRHLKFWECFYLEPWFSEVTSSLLQLTFAWGAVSISAHKWTCCCLICLQRKMDSLFVFPNNISDMLSRVEYLRTNHFSPFN